MKKLVVVGNGMAGMACLEQILKYAPRFDVTVFSDETHVNYNRVLLSSVLAGEKGADDIVINGLEWYQRHGIDLRVGVRMVDVDARAKTVTGNDGRVTPYDTLLLATGSSPWFPPIAGLDKDGVFAFRTLDDTRALLGRAGPQTRAVVIGGGLLGLEAARGLQVQGCDVTVVHLHRHADGTAARSLRRRLPAVEDRGAGRERAARPAAPRRFSAATRSPASSSRTARRSRPISSWWRQGSDRTSSWAGKPA